jgi:hypothetical protein
MKKQKLLVTVFAGLLFLVGAGMAAAQSRGGGMGGGGGMHGGGMGGGGMQGGGGWHGGGGGWNGGWHGGGGSWNGGWHGGGWHGGTRFGVFFGFPGTWWWPAYYPYGAYPYYGYYGYGGYPYYGGYYGGGYYGGGYYGASGGDPGDVVYVQRDTAPAAPSAPAMRSSPPGEYSYYCIDPPGYYPQVQQCTKAWLKVVPDGSPRPTPVPQYSQ